MSDILNHIEEHPKETQRLMGLDYEQLQQLIQNAERLHHEKQALLESKKVRIIVEVHGVSVAEEKEESDQNEYSRQIQSGTQEYSGLAA